MLESRLMALSWWLWLLLGFVLLVFELMTPQGFFIFFFGVGAIFVGLLALAGIAGPPWFQWILFAVLSTAGLLFLRKPLQERLRPLGRDVDSLTKETAVAMDEIGVHQVGKAELRGSAWNARNVGEMPIARGQRCTIERVEGLMLWIRG